MFVGKDSDTLAAAPRKSHWVLAYFTKREMYWWLYHIDYKIKQTENDASFINLHL